MSSRSPTVSTNSTAQPSPASPPSPPSSSIRRRERSPRRRTLRRSTRPPKRWRAAAGGRSRSTLRARRRLRCSRRLADAGATQVEPGHGLTGTTPLHAVEDLPELPAVVYVSEVSHLHGGDAYCFGGGLYIDPVFPDYAVKAIVSREPTAASAALRTVEIPPPAAIDYYGMIDTSSGPAPRRRHSRLRLPATGFRHPRLHLRGVGHRRRHAFGRRDP